jgi:NAD(P)-dependent dehydrogenase (short-subunit alcohol dehydrogenase family)
MKLLEAVRQEIVGLDVRAYAVAVDVTSIDSILAAQDEATGALGAIDILVNNAAASVNRDPSEISEHDWDLIMDTGPKGVFFCSQILGSAMRDRGYGKIINLSSTLSQGVVPGATVYGASKAAIGYLTRSLAAEWARYGVRVNALAPASTLTPSRMSGMTPDRKAALVSRIPLGRLGTVEDLVPAAVFLASPESDFVTGQTLYVDGGWTARS